MEKENNNDNLTNFIDQLVPKYRNSLIEFVTETSFNEKSFNITEKTLHSIYGYNFPIFISSPGTVAFLREIGMDMFDDIIDHSYDSIENGPDRINAAIDLNIQLLIDPIKTTALWQKHKYRLENNVSFVKTKLTEYYTSRFWKHF